MNMKWFKHFVCVGVCCTGLLGQVFGQSLGPLGEMNGVSTPSTRNQAPPTADISAVNPVGISTVNPVGISALPNTPEVSGIGFSQPALEVSAQPSLSSLLGSNNSGNSRNENHEALGAVDLVFLKFGYAQGIPVYLIDERRREGLVFFSVPVQEFQRITNIVLPELEPGLLTQVPILPELHMALKQSFAGSMFQIELPTGLENSPDGGVRVVTTLVSKTMSSNSTNRESDE
jgi:hypothetical protein